MQKKTIKVGDKDVEVRQFLMVDLEEPIGDGQKSIDLLVDYLAGSPAVIRRLLALCTDFAEADLKKIGANDFALLARAMREMNTDFFAMWRERLIALAELKMLLPGSSAAPEPSIGSSGKGTKKP